MKLHSKNTEIPIFLLIFFFFVIPPFFTSQINSESYSLSFNSFPIINIIYFILSVFLYNFYKDSIEKNKFFFFYKVIFPFIFAFCVLISISFFIKGISFFIIKNIESQNLVLKPDNLITVIYCLISFFCSAFFEEVIYRFYCPEILYYITGKIKNIKIQFVIVESICLFLFSFAHFYLGFLSVINACLAHIVLRICFKYSKTIIPGFLAHFIYNIISLILL